MSVCIYSPSENIWGGGQIYIDNLCRYLNQHGIDAVIASSEPEAFSAPAIYMSSVASKKRRLTSAPALGSALKKQGYRVIVLNDLSSLWLAPIFRLYGLKVVSLLHLYLQKKNQAGLGHGWFEYHLLRLASRAAHQVYSVNKDNQKSLPVPVDFVGNFISQWFFEATGSEYKRYDIGLIARLSVQKNVPLFVRLVAKLNGISDRPIKALIVGKGEEEASVRREIERYGMRELVEVRPWVDRSDLPAVFDQLRCFAITSHHEGFATTVLEAHARGVPVVTTRSAGFCAEFVKDVGAVTGMVFEPEDVDSKEFIHELNEMIANCTELSAACERKARRFDEDLVLGRIADGVWSLVG